MAVMVGVYMFFLIVWILLGYGIGNAPEETRRRLGEFREALRLRTTR
jgi:hypothetical protein